MLAHEERDYAGWLIQGNPDVYDIDAYLLNYNPIYWTIKAYLKDVREGDRVYIWRAAGKGKAVSGIIAAGIVEEGPREREEVRLPQNLGDELWKGVRGDGSTGQSRVIGIRLLDVRLTREERMIGREQAKEDGILGGMGIFGYAATGIWALKSAELERLAELWEEAAGEDLAPTADPEELDRRVKRLLKLGRVPRPRGDSAPRRQEERSLRFARRPDVKAWVLQTAAGRCERCGSEAPFVGADGLPFLEVHHVVWLAQEGPDTVENAVALCPNCHRECHHGENLVAAREEIYGKVVRLVRPGCP